MDLLSSDSPHSTPLETQFTVNETFSLEELGLSPVRESPTEMQPARRPRKQGRDKGKGTTSRGAGAEEVGEEAGGRKRTVWSIGECVALAKAWVGVVEDPYIGANQHIDRMWWRISQSYLQFTPPGGKPHDGEQCRKQWERLRRQLSRFAGIYQNNLRTATSGMSADDVKLLSHQQFPDSELGFGEFKFWEVYLVVQTSAKFSSGVEAGWPKRTKINASGEYSSSGGSHELPDAEAEFPTPQSSSRRRRPVGQKTAMRMARGSASGSPEVQSAAPSQIDPELPSLARMQAHETLIHTMEKWYTVTDPLYKLMLKDVIDSMRRDLGMPPLPVSDAGTGHGDDGTSGGDDEE